MEGERERETERKQMREGSGGVNDKEKGEYAGEERQEDNTSVSS